MRYIIIQDAEARLLKKIPDFEAHSYAILDIKGVEDHGRGAFFVDEDWCIKARQAAKRRYRHVGYYHEVSDLLHLSQRPANDIIAYFKENTSGLVRSKEPDRESDIVPADELDNIMSNVIRFTSDGRFAVSDTTWPSWKAEHADCENENSNAFIDIYELRD